MAKNPSVRWTTELTAFGKNAGIVVPPELIEQLGHGQRPPVSVNLNGHEFRTTVGVMAGQHLVSVSAAIRSATGLAAGDSIDVTLTVDATPRTVDVPADLAAALKAGGVRPFFDKLSNSLQRYHVDNVNGAKSDDTRAKRVAKAVELFQAGKQR
jgi:hypothetical protein